uniref:Uncharacterized protein n=1 Tax=Anguilla anguilla TaxID=7936 RepID=A0A0E9RI84_ANGAN
MIFICPPRAVSSTLVSLVGGWKNAPLQIKPLTGSHGI